MPPPTHKDNWIARFMTRMQELRPDIGSKFSSVIGNIQWREQKGVEPRVAADRWVASSAKAKP